MKNKFGFSILELMVAVGISGLAAVGVMQMTEDQVKVQKKVQIEFDVDTLVGVVQKVIGNKDACNNTFNGQNINDGKDSRTVIPLIRGPGLAPQILLTTGGVYGNLTIENIEFVKRDDVEEIANGGNAPVSKKIIGDIELTVTRNSQFITTSNGAANAFSGNLVRRLPFPIELIVANTGPFTFQDCNPLAVDISGEVQDAFCRILTNGNIADANLPSAAGGGNCDLSLITASNEIPEAGGFPPPATTMNTRAASTQFLADQIAKIQDDTVATRPTVGADPGLFTTGPPLSETTFDTVVIDQPGNVRGRITLDAAPGATIEGDPTQNNSVIPVRYFKDKTNFEGATACPGSSQGLAGNGERKCITNTCGGDQYATGLASLIGPSNEKRAAFSCETLAVGLPTECPNDEGVLVVDAAGAITYECCTSGTWSAWSNTCTPASCNGYQSRTCSCGTCGGGASTRPCANNLPPTDATWSPWSVWSACAGGTQSRSRTCTPGNACATNTTCVGSAIESRTCTPATPGPPPPSGPNPAQCRDFADPIIGATGDCGDPSMVSCEGACIPIATAGSTCDLVGLIMDPVTPGQATGYSTQPASASNGCATGATYADMPEGATDPWQWSCDDGSGPVTCTATREQKVWFDGTPFDWSTNFSGGSTGTSRGAIYDVSKNRISNGSINFNSCTSALNGRERYLVLYNPSGNISGEWYVARCNGSSWVNSRGCPASSWCGDATSSSDEITTPQATMYYR